MRSITMRPHATSARGIAVTLRADARARRLRRGLTVAACALVAVMLGVVQLFLTGDAEITPGSVLPAAFGGGDGLADYVVRRTNLPRGLVAILGGALFGISGALAQRLFGNPLATPDVIGISSGAGAGAMIVIAGLGATGLGVQGGAMLGALVVSLLVYGLSWRGGVHSYTLILIGIGVGACASAIITFVVTRLDEASTQRAMRWLIGSLNGADAHDVALLACTLLVGAAFMLWLRRGLSDLALGDELAAGLGVHVPVVRFAALLLATMLAAIVTSVTGPIAFVALVAGPIATRMLRVPDAPLAAGVVGAVLLCATDIAAQTMPLVSPVPTGAITALFGAPVLIALLVRRKATV